MNWDCFNGEMTGGLLFLLKDKNEILVCLIKIYSIERKLGQVSLFSRLNKII